MNIDLIKQVSFSSSQYYRKKYEKKQIYLHHTISGNSVENDINHWSSTKARVATCILIARDGTIYQVFSSKYWAHHLGIKKSVFASRGLPSINTTLNKKSIGIELDNWGPMIEQGGEYFSTAGTKVPGHLVYHNNFRKYLHYEIYTVSQIKALRQLLVYFSGKYSIDVSYNDDIWGVNDRALRGESGLYTHCSVRSDKSDVSPYPPLIDMLKTL